MAMSMLVAILSTYVPSKGLKELFVAPFVLIRRMVKRILRSPSLNEWLCSAGNNILGSIFVALKVSSVESFAGQPQLAELL